MLGTLLTLVETPGREIDDDFVFYFIEPEGKGRYETAWLGRGGMGQAGREGRECIVLVPVNTIVNSTKICLSYKRINNCT